VGFVHTIHRIRRAWWMYDMSGLGWYIRRPRRLWQDRWGIAASILDFIEEVFPRLERHTTRYLQP
jgi:hypothetical protein